MTWSNAFFASLFRWTWFPCFRSDDDDERIGTFFHQQVRYTRFDDEFKRLTSMAKSTMGRFGGKRRLLILLGMLMSAPMFGVKRLVPENLRRENRDGKRQST